MTKTKLLVLSDLHYGSLHHFQRSEIDRRGGLTLSESITNALKQADVEVDGMLLLGDFLSKHEDENADLTKAEKGLNDLLQNVFWRKSGKKLDDHEIRERVMAIPGNHDVSWSRNDSMRFIYYDHLMNTLRLDSTSNSFPLIKHWSGPDKISNLGAENDSSHQDEAGGVVVVGINACIYEQKHTAGMGLIGERQMMAIRNKLSNLHQCRRAKHKIAIVHHQVVPVDLAELEFDRSENGEQKITKLPSVIMDAHKLLDLLHDFGFTALFHGHRHLCVRSSHTTGSSADGSHELSIFSTGTCGSRWIMYRHFYVAEFDGDELDVKSFKTSPDGDAFELKETQRVAYSNPRLVDFRDNSIKLRVCDIALSGNDVVRSNETHVQSIFSRFLREGNPESERSNLQSQKEKKGTGEEKDVYVAVANGKWIQTLIAPSISDKTTINLHLKLMNPSVYEKLRQNGWIKQKEYIDSLKGRIGLLIKEVGLERCQFYLWDNLQQVHATRVGNNFWCGHLTISHDGMLDHHQGEVYLGEYSNKKIKDVCDKIWGKSLDVNSKDYRSVLKFFGIDETIRKHSRNA